MTYGPGKYDDAATRVRLETGAQAVVVIVIEGRQGSGFAVQTDPGRLTRKRLAVLLRGMADEIEKGDN